MGVCISRWNKILFFIMLSLILSPDSIATASNKLGASCPKINSLVSVGNQVLVCSKYGTKLKWKVANSAQTVKYFAKVAADSTATNEVLKASIEALAAKTAVDAAAAKIALDAAIAKIALDAAIAKIALDAAIAKIAADAVIDAEITRAAAETSEAKAAAVEEVKAVLDKAALNIAISTCPSNAKSLKVGVAYDIGGRGDRGVNDSTGRGVEWLKACGVTVIEVNTTSGSDSDRQEKLLALTKVGCNPVIAVGFLYSNPLKIVAAQKPTIRFAILDDASVALPNVTSLVFSVEQGSYLAGVAAAYATRTGKIGFIGGVDIPLFKKRAAEFVAGVKAVNKEAVVEIQYISRFPDFVGLNDPQRAKLITSAMIEKGIDVIYSAAWGSNMGTFAAAAMSNKRIWTIGDEIDYYFLVSDLEKNNMLTSVLRNYDVAIFNFVRKVANSEYWYENIDTTVGVYGHTFGLSDGGVSLSITGGFLKYYLASIDNARLLYSHK